MREYTFDADFVIFVAGTSSLDFYSIKYVKLVNDVVVVAMTQYFMPCMDIKAPSATALSILIVLHGY